MTQSRLKEVIVYNPKNGMFKWISSGSGYDIDDVKSKTLDFNGKLPDSLPEKEIRGTVFKSLQNKYKG